MEVPFEMTTHITQLFNQARTELYCPPCRLVLEGEKKVAFPSPLSVVNGLVSFRPGLVPQGSDRERFLLWYFRHELAHVHHCPYDIRTAYDLERSAYETVRQWNLSYLATYIFSELQVNLNYLPRRFHEIPYSIQALRSQRPRGLEQILYEAYKQVLPEMGRPSGGAVAEAAREICIVVRSTRPWNWHTKVQMISMILERLRARNQRLFSEGKMQRFIREHPIQVREDYYPDSARMFAETYGTISDQETAHEFFEQWIEPRIPKEKGKDAKKALKKKIRIQKWKRRRKKKKGGGRGEGEPSHMLGGLKPEGKPKPEETGRGKPTGELSGGEPRLSTSLSRPYRRFGSKVLDEAYWKRYWYRSRAEKTLIRYLAESPSRRPVWAVMRYPDEWYIEDEIEDLDIEMSLDEGSLLPEVTTRKWVKEPTSQGQSVISGFVPSAITVLDTSLSMSKIHDTAATAAFITYLSARNAGGQTSALTFSTRYAAANWGDLEETKEMVLSMAFDEFTVFPAYEVMNLASKAAGNCFILVITDGGWQNIDEAIPLVQRVADRGHKVFIFLLPGGEYPERIEKIKRSPELKVYKVKNPERDLQGLVLSKTMKTYETFLM